MCKEEYTMTFDELLTKIKTLAGQADVSGMDFLAVQVNVTGANEGTFYVEVKDGKISVEPYEYNDRQCAVTISGDNLDKLIDGKLDPVAAFTVRKLKVDGDVSKALEFSKLVKKK